MFVLSWVPFLACNASCYYLFISYWASYSWSTAAISFETFLLSSFFRVFSVADCSLVCGRMKQRQVQGTRPRETEGKRAENGVSDVGSIRSEMLRLLSKSSVYQMEMHWSHFCIHRYWTRIVLKECHVDTRSIQFEIVFKRLFFVCVVCTSRVCVCVCECVRVAISFVRKTRTRTRRKRRANKEW